MPFTELPFDRYPELEIWPTPLDNLPRVDVVRARHYQNRAGRIRFVENPLPGAGGELLIYACTSPRLSTSYFKAYKEISPKSAVEFMREIMKAEQNERIPRINMPSDNLFLLLLTESLMEGARNLIRHLEPHPRSISQVETELRLFGRRGNGLTLHNFNELFKEDYYGRKEQ